MPTNQRISEMTSAATLNGTDIIEIAQVNAGSTSGYASAKTTLTAIANKVNTEIQYGGLNTTAKTIVGAINEAAQSGGGGDAANHNIADEFDSTSTYAVGDYVIYDGDLYKCTSAITTAGAWDSTKWAQTIIVDEMGSGGGGGTTVVANPIGTATDDLTKIQIGSTIYDIPGSGGAGGGFDLLWQNSDTTQPFSGQTVMATGLSDYDWVGVIYNESSDAGGQNPIELMIYENRSGAKTTTHEYSDTGILIARAFSVSGDAVTFTDGFRPGTGYYSNYMIPVAIYGIQAGSSTSGQIDYSTTEKKTGQKWIDGSAVYQKTIVATLNTQYGSEPAYDLGELPSGFDVLISAEGSVRIQNGIGYAILNGIDNINGWSFGLHITGTPKHLMLYGGNGDIYNMSAIANGTAVVTLKYTKSSS